MNRQLLAIFAMGTFVYFGGPAISDDPPGSSVPEPVPVTRDDMKRALDASKQAVPRLPAPPLTEEEQDLIEWQKAEAERTGENPRRYGLANNGRMRAYYLAEYGFSLADSLERTRSGESPFADSALDRSFRTMLFWIVSRGNNCTYCLGHQEAGLAARGLSDDDLAALDFDWSAFDDAHQAAFRFTRKLSFEPFAINDQDIEALRRQFTEEQVLEMVVTVAGFNATNRWTGPLRIQQDVLFQFERPTSAKYATAASQIAPLDSPSLQGAVLPRSRQRPPLESAAEVRASLDAARNRTPRFALADQDATRKLIDDASSEVAAEPWARLLATLPNGEKRIAAYQAVIDSGTLAPRTKAIIAYVAARHDRAWYAVGHAMERLKSLGFSDTQIFSLGDPDMLAAESDRAVVEFARTLTIDPALVTDADFARLRASFNDKQVAEIVYVVSQAAFFDRLTEAAGLSQ